MIRRGRTLMTAPYVGEFGWELMNWQARIRRLAMRGEFDRVIVVAPPDRARLYHVASAPAQVEFRPVELPPLPGEASEDHRVLSGGRRVSSDELRAWTMRILQRVSDEEGLDAGEVTYFLPGFDGRLWTAHGKEQAFDDTLLPRPIRFDVVLVPRQRQLADERNAPATWWGEVAERLCEAGLRVATYGPTLDDAVNQLTSARLAIGASTGGLHLASLCRCPHYVWGCDSSRKWTRLGMSNRQRYETFWNPLGTPVWYDECGWRPLVDHVVNQTLEALEEIGRPASSGAVRHGFNLRWRVRRTLARVVEAGDGWPWRMRRWVQNSLL